MHSFMPHSSFHHPISFIPLAYPIVSPPITCKFISPIKCTIFIYTSKMNFSYDEANGDKIQKNFHPGFDWRRRGTFRPFGLLLLP